MEIPTPCDTSALDALLEQLDTNPDDDRVTTTRSVLVDLRAAASAHRSAERRIGNAVIAARAAGLSWGIIGAQLRITRQGARQRFQHLTG